MFFFKYFSYHATAALEEAQKLARQKIPSAAALQLHSFTFDDFGLENDEMLQVKQKKIICCPPTHYRQLAFFLLIMWVCEEHATQCSIIRVKSEFLRYVIVALIATSETKINGIF